MITKEKFADMIMEDLHKLMPEEMLNACKIEKTYIRKDNDIVLTGICFNKGANMPSPTFYVDEAYKAFQNGESYDALINALVESAVEHWEMKAPIDIDNMDYDELKDKLIYTGSMKPANYNTMTAGEKLEFTKTTGDKSVVI